MTLNVIPKRLQRVWDKCNIRGSVLASLCLQILLIFLAPSRKRTRGNFITTILWSVYLLADFVAAYAIGLISNNQGDECDKSNVNDALSAFWAPFLLLHLGGPDSITAFALEDNELWTRHLFTLIAKVILVAYVFTQATPFPLWLPTVLVYLAGVIKYAERTRALYLACLDNLNKDLTTRDIGIEPDKEALTIPMEITLKETEVVQYGFYHYKVFRKLIVDHMLSIRERKESRKFFLQLKALDAFRIMEVELNFMYDALYTKLATVHQSYLWYIFRFICTTLIAASLFLFKSHHKPHIHRLDISITYSLLIGAIILELIASIKLVFSDWTVALLKSKKALNPIYTIHKHISFRGRWSNSMGQHNLISFSLKKRRFKLFDKVVGFFGLDEILMYKKFIPVEDDLKLFIFSVIKEKAHKANRIEDGKEVYSSRGHLALKKYRVSSSTIVETVDEVEFEESVLIWHIATDILYYRYTPDHNSNNNHQNLSKILTDYILHLRIKKSSSTDPEEAHNVDYKKFCKILSDYMLYLIVLQPSLISVTSATSQARFLDTCDAIKRFSISPQIDKREARDEVLSKSELSESSKVAITPVLVAAHDLEMELDRLQDDKKWEMVSEVWVELLCYGASHCKGNTHAQQLSKGGGGN